MSSDRGRSEHRAMTAAMLALIASALATSCISVDTYPPPPRFDGGLDASSDFAVPDTSSEACMSCLARQCEPEWAPCNGDPDCMACMTDPLGEACTRSTNRRPIRNCGCVAPTCYDVCTTFCFKDPPGGDLPSRISDECIACTATKCADLVAACIADSVCFACVTDSANPRCAMNQVWVDTTACLCTTPRHCFEECCFPLVMPPP